MNDFEILKLQQYGKWTEHYFTLKHRQQDAPDPCGRLRSLWRGRQSSRRSQMARGLWLLSREVGRLRPLLVQGQARGISASTQEQLHVCVVGSGPAGFYTADRVGDFTTCGYFLCSWSHRSCFEDPFRFVLICPGNICFLVDWWFLQYLDMICAAFQF